MKNLTHLGRILLSIIGSAMFAPTVGAQPRADATWVGGFEEYAHLPGHANYRIRFAPGQLPAVDTTDWGIPIEATVASVSDEAGRLLFFSNGCVVAGADGHLMENGEGLNPGYMADLTCAKRGYPVPRGAMILPVPSSPQQYCLFHLGARYDPQRLVHYGPFYRSAVDLAAGGGKGGVTAKNEVLADGELSPPTAVRHGNGRDWWVFVPTRTADTLYRFLLGPSGVLALPPLPTGARLPERGPLTAVFSPNGARMALYRPRGGALVADFDRCTGDLSAPKFLRPPERLTEGGGAAFSPDNHFLYLGSQTALYALDLSSNDPHWAVLANTLDNHKWGTTFQHFQYGPDGLLYISTASRANYLNALSPLGSASAPVFKLRAMPLPVKNARTLPNFPNFRLYDWPDSPCDTLGIDAPTIGADAPKVPGHRVEASPNPVSREIFLRDLPQGPPVGRTLTVFSLEGRPQWSETLPAGQTETRIDCAGWPPGTYFWRLEYPDGQMAQGRFVKI